MLFLLLVTLISMVIALIMSVIAWRVARDERRRSNARVAQLAADIHDPDRTERTAPRVEPDLELRRPVEPPAPIPAAGLFETTSAARSTPRLAAVLGIGVLVFGSLAAALVLGTGSTAEPVSSHVAADAASPLETTKAHRSGSPVPLELLALGHVRDGDRLTVRGVVRNPAAGGDLNSVSAVVFLYNRDGVFLASGREEILSPTLGPGGESSFTVTMPDAKDVGRYRVSFRTDDRVIPHVDQRDRRDHGQEKS